MTSHIHLLLRLKFMELSPPPIQISALHSTHRLYYQIICWKVVNFDYPEDRGFSETSVTNHESPLRHILDKCNGHHKRCTNFIPNIVHLHRFIHINFGYSLTLSTIDVRMLQLKCAAFTVSIITSTISLEFTHGVLRGFESCDFDKEFI